MFDCLVNGVYNSWIGLEESGGVALLEEACQWEWAIQVQSLSLCLWIRM